MMAPEESNDSPVKTRKTRRTSPIIAGAADEAGAPPPLPRVAAPVVDEATARQMRIIERRMVSPTVSVNHSIRLKNKGLVVRVFNGEKAGRLYHAVHELGWRPLHIDEIEDRAQIGDISTSPEGYIVRGEKGREMFMVMPKDAFDRIQRKKVQIRERKQNMHGKGKRDQIDELAEATANRFGSDEAGDSVRKFKGINPDHSVVMELDS
jgi:Fe-S cluster biosynthesis and repair protein YggX